MIRAPEAVGVQGATRAGERQTHSGTTRKQTRNRRYGVVIIARCRRFHIPHLAILRTADDTSLAIADDLLRCDWLGRLN